MYIPIYVYIRIMCIISKRGTYHLSVLESGASISLPSISCQKDYLDHLLNDAMIQLLSVTVTLTLTVVSILIQIQSQYGNIFLFRFCFISLMIAYATIMWLSIHLLDFINDILH